MSNFLSMIHVRGTNIFVQRVRRSELGQATVEYALLVLGAAAIALLLVAWAAKTGKIDALLERIFDSVTSKVA